MFFLNCVQFKKKTTEFWRKISFSLLCLLGGVFCMVTTFLWFSLSTLVCKSFLEHQRRTLGFQVSGEKWVWVFYMQMKISANWFPLLNIMETHEIWLLEYSTAICAGALKLQLSLQWRSCLAHLPCSFLIEFWCEESGRSSEFSKLLKLRFYWSAALLHPCIQLS